MILNRIRSLHALRFWIVLFASLFYISSALAKEMVVVTVTGMGKDIEAASQDAARLALSEVSGSLLQSSKSVVVSKDAFTPIIRNVKSNIRDYGAGVISNFSIKEISRIGTLTAVTADVGVRMTEFRGYLATIAQAEAELPEDLSVRQSVEQRQDTNITSLLQNRIANPILTGEGLEFSISKPRLVSDVPELENFILDRHGEDKVSPVGVPIDTRKAFFFELTIKLKEDFKKVMIDTLSRSASLVNDLSLNSYGVASQPFSSFDTPSHRRFNSPRFFPYRTDKELGTSGNDLVIFLTNTTSQDTNFYVYKNLLARLEAGSLVHPGSWCPNRWGEKFRKVDEIRFPTLELQVIDNHGRKITKFTFKNRNEFSGFDYWATHRGQGKAIIIGWSTPETRGAYSTNQLSEHHPPWIPFGPDADCYSSSRYLYISDERKLIILWEPPTGMLSESSAIEVTLGQ
jgi:hypothetical protein